MDKFESLDDAIGRGILHDVSEPKDCQLLEPLQGEYWHNHLDQYFSDEQRCYSVLSGEAQLTPKERRALRDSFVKERESYGFTEFAIFEDNDAPPGRRFVLADYEEAM
jgi:hypothetical protein